jgi:hypothetical protein
MEAHVTRSVDSVYDRAKQALLLETDRPHVLREMIYVCRPAGTLSIPVSLEKGQGMYKVFRDKLDGCVKVVLKS